MPANRYRGPPMTLANVRENGVRSLSVTCELCRHAALINADAFDDAMPLPAFGPRMVCTGCGIVGADVRPNWQERSGRESLTGVQWRAEDEAANRELANLSILAIFELSIVIGNGTPKIG